MSVMKEVINILENMKTDAEGLSFYPGRMALVAPLTTPCNLSVLWPEALLKGSHPLAAE